MSIQETQSRIVEFLNSDEPEVLSIRGAWGVGKTYTWNRFLKEAQINGKIALKKYSYISLFGLSTLDSLKIEMFQNSIGTNLIGEPINLTTLNNNIENVLPSLTKKSGRNIAKMIPWLKDAVPFIDAASFLSLNETIICIDDFERKGTNLQAKDILGLVSILKEQKRCKIVLIFNEKTLDSISKSDYKQYREKVIDKEVLFEPTPKECADIVLNKENVIEKELAELIERYEITNVRVISKIKRQSQEILSYTEGLIDGFVTNILSSMILLTNCYFCGNNDELPSLDFMKNYSLSYSMIGEEEKSDTEKKHIRYLNDLGWNTTDNVDLELIKYLERGFIDIDSFAKVLEEENQNYVNHAAIQKVQNVWDLLNHSFDDNEQQLVDEINEVYRETAQYIGADSLNVAVTMLRKLEHESVANELVDHFIKMNQHREKIFDLANYHFAHHIDDRYLKEQFEKEYKKATTRSSAKDVLLDITSRNGWADKDIAILSEASVEEYMAIFTNEKSEKLPYMIQRCLEFGKVEGGGEALKTIADKAQNAVRLIAKDSKLNRFRAKRLGIKFEDETEQQN